jgi:hypothetical protein
VAVPAAPPVQGQVVQVQGQAVVPVQGHAVVPVQGQAVLPVQGQGVVPLQGQPVVTLQAQAPVAPAAACPAGTAPLALPLSEEALKNLDPREVEEFCRRVEALKAALEARRGTPLPPIKEK